MPPDSGEIAELLERAGEGDEGALGRLLEVDRARLLRMVRVRLDPRIRPRLDASDIIQEVHIEAARRLSEYLEAPAVPFYLWIRRLAEQRLVDAYRRHLGAKKRDARREAADPRTAILEITSAALVDQLVGSMTTPSRAAARAELSLRVRGALDELDPMDREVLALRHFEQLSNAETALALGIEKAAASKRYVRALKRLRAALESEGDVSWEARP